MTQRLFHLQFSKAGGLATECAVNTAMTITAFAIAIGALVVWHQPGAFWFALLFGLYLLVFIVFGERRRFDITTDDHAISTFAFGRNWQRIAWPDIARIRIKTVPDIEKTWFAPPPLNCYDIYSSDRSLRARIVGPVCFSARITDVRELLDIINANIQGRSVEVIDARDKDNPVKRDRL